MTWRKKAAEANCSAGRDGWDACEGPLTVLPFELTTCATLGFEKASCLASMKIQLGFDRLRETK